ncbi:MbtH family protein [Kitasatospora sp. McL0602]|uniref:MbtH family protein n=1 Tax=Kitasatospora sp. McL0602 TaxID=3439530 RepID=UPI003F8A2AFD
MTDDPFNDPAGRYRVLVNDAGDHSLWPVFAAIPAGWSVTLEEATRTECLDHINSHWTVGRAAAAGANADRETARVKSNV